MIQDLAAATGSSAIAITVMFGFIAAFAVVAVRLWRRDPRRTETEARLPLDDRESDGTGSEGVGGDGQGASREDG